MGIKNETVSPEILNGVRHFIADALRIDEANIENINAADLLSFVITLAETDCSSFEEQYKQIKPPADNNNAAMITYSSAKAEIYGMWQYLQGFIGILRMVNQAVFDYDKNQKG